MSITVGILTVSDRAYQGVYEDKSGPFLHKEIKKLDWVVADYAVVADEIESIELVLVQWCDQKNLDLILTTGGTGLGPRDVTPEATRQVLDKDLPGFAEHMRREGAGITPLALLSRAACGSRKQSLIINLPGSPTGACESFRAICHLIPHALQMLRGENHSVKAIKNV